MAITVGSPSSGYREDTGITDGNEIIVKLNAAHKYIIDCIVTSAGTASLKVMTGTIAPVDFSGMSIANDGTQSANFSREVFGCSYIGIDVASGTWTQRIRRAS